MIEHCPDCRFFEINPYGQIGVGGHCHRYPPIVEYSEQQGSTVIFPPVDWNDWCGEFEAKVSVGLVRIEQERGEAND